MNPLHRHLLFTFLLILFCTACSTSDEPKTQQSSQRYQKGEYIYRHHQETFSQVPVAEAQTLDPYPWEKGNAGNYPKITKEFFRCKGSNLNPVRVVQEKGNEPSRYFDCGGAEKHSLPLRNKKEFIYPILIDLVNYIQAKTQKRIVITSGHRCPEHNTYVDSSPSNQYSKHMLGAEVSFYVQGMENDPNSIVKSIQDYFKETAKYQGQKEFIEFQRYEKSDSNISTNPWYNKEVFIKIFKTKEGRNFDNRHPYPYISIQVRLDYDTNEKVVYSWDKAYHNFLRH